MCFKLDQFVQLKYKRQGTGGMLPQMSHFSPLGLEFIKFIEKESLIDNI
jgi:hypothetical protein